MQFLIQTFIEHLTTKTEMENFFSHFVNVIYSIFPLHEQDHRILMMGNKSLSLIFLSADSWFLSNINYFYYYK